MVLAQQQTMERIPSVLESDLAATLAAAGAGLLYGPGAASSQGEQAAGLLAELLRSAERRQEVVGLMQRHRRAMPGLVQTLHLRFANALQCHSSTRAYVQAAMHAIASETLCTRGRWLRESLARCGELLRCEWLTQPVPTACSDHMYLLSWFGHARPLLDVHCQESCSESQAAPA
jgi:hypothetical protein